MGNSQFVPEGAADGRFYGCLGSGGGIRVIIEQADEGEAGIGWVEEGPVAVVGAPVIGIPVPGGQATCQLVGALFRGGTINIVAGSLIQFGGSAECAVVVDDVFLTVVGHGGGFLFDGGGCVLRGLPGVR